MRLEDGRGRCAGRLEVKYEGTWQRVHEQDWTEANSNTVCSQLACGGARATSQKWFPQGSAAFFSKKVGCPPKAGHIAECGTSNWDAPPVGQSAVMLVCEGGCSPSLPALNVFNCPTNLSSADLLLKHGKLCVLPPAIDPNVIDLSSAISFRG